jgi:hypothetical protein
MDALLKTDGKANNHSASSLMLASSTHHLPCGTDVQISDICSHLQEDATLHS